MNQQEYDNAIPDDDLNPGAPPSGPRLDLRGATFRGVRWLSLARLLAEVSNLATLVVLSRLLSPSQYGLAALVLVFSSVAVVLSSEGFGNPLVQAKTIDRRQVVTAHTLSLGTVAALTIIVELVGPAATSPIFGASIRPLVREGALSLAFAGIGAVPTALLQRRLDFRWLAVSDGVSTIVGSVITIVMAFAGAGPSSLVVGIVATQALNTGMMVAKSGWPGLGWSNAAFRSNASYGVPATAAALLAVVFSSEDNVVVGASLGPAALGIYYRAFSLGVSYQRRASQIIVRLMFPILSRSTDAAHMGRIRSRITRTQCLVMFWPLSLLVVTAPTLVPMLLSSKWIPAVLPTQVLAVAGMVGCLTDATNQLLLAAGKAVSLMRGIFVLCVVYGTAVFAGTAGGVVGAAVGATAVYAAWLFLAYRFQVGPALGSSTSSLLADSAPGFVASAALVAVGLPVGELLHRAGLPNLVVFVVTAVAGTAIYAGVLRVVFPQMSRELLVVAKTLARRDRPAATAYGVHAATATELGAGSASMPRRDGTETNRAG